MRTTIRNVVFSFSCLALTLQGPIAVAQEAAAGTKFDAQPLAPLPSGPKVDGPTPPESYAELVERADALKPIVERLRNAIDRTQFDPTELNSSLDFDPEALARFVTEEIYFEQYVGILRGAKGTLVGLSGNALDQSLLLSSLLDVAGYDVRIARGVLSNEDSSTLIRQMTKPRPPMPTAVDSDLVSGVMDDIARLPFVTRERMEELRHIPETPRNPFLAETEQASRLIIEKLEEAGVSLGDSAIVERLAKEAADYYWVEYRTDAYDDWREAHVAFNDGYTPNVNANETFLEPPDSLYHKIRFEVFVEQKIGDKLYIQPALVSIEEKTASLVGKPFTYRTQPNSFDVSAAPDIDEIVKSAAFFVPVVNGRAQGTAFDLDGRLFDMDLQSSNTATITALLQAQARQLEHSIVQIGGTGEGSQQDNLPDDFITLTAQWIDYTIVTPGDAETTYRRYVLDRIGSQNRAEGTAQIVMKTPLTKLARRLLANYTVFVNSTRYNSAYVADRIAGRTLQELELLTQLAEIETPSGLIQNEIASPPSALDAVLSAVVDTTMKESDVVYYRSEPFVVTHEEGIVELENDSAGLFERVDIVHNTKRSFRSMDHKLTGAPERLVRAGVWETLNERILLKHGAGAAFGTPESFRLASNESASVHVITGNNVGRLETLFSSDRLRNSIRDDLSRGFVAIVPGLKTESDIAWWRVNPETGETLGVTTGGYGITKTEYTIARFVINYPFTFISAGMCMRKGNTDRNLCCLVMALGMHFIGQAIGSKITSARLALPNVGMADAGPFSFFTVLGSWWLPNLANNTGSQVCDQFRSYHVGPNR